MQATHEQKLIAAAQAGDTRAFDRLVEVYQDYLYRLMVRACHNPEDAEEVATDAFARAYERLAQFEGRSSFVTWLGRIAANLCFRRLEKAEVPAVSIETPGVEEMSSLAASTEAQTSGPEQAALQAEMRRLVHAAMAELPEPDQTVLRLRDVEQLPAAIVSARTGLTQSAVKSRLHRARRALRVKLNNYFLGSSA